MSSNSIYKTAESRDILIRQYEAFLAQWPIATERIDVATKFGKTFVLAWGNPKNPALVLLHGSMSNSAIWAGEAPVFGQAFRVYAVDLLGEPGHSAPTRPDMQSGDPEVWLGQVLDQLGVEKTHLLGASMGAVYALRFAAACPERVNRLVMFCPGGVTGTRLSFLWRVLQLALLGGKSAGGSARLVYGRAEVPEEAIAYTQLITAHFNPVLGVPVLPDALLARIQAPALVIAGDADVMLDSAKSIRRLNRFLPEVQSVLLPGVSHVVVGQAERVAAFLGQ